MWELLLLVGKTMFFLRKLSQKQAEVLIQQERKISWIYLVLHNMLPILFMEVQEKCH